MFAIGHIALAYLFGRGVSKYLGVKVILPLLFVVAVLPDADLLFPFMLHRGLTHSLLMITAFVIPFFFVYGKVVLVYFAGLLSHTLIGDLVGGSMWFWPVSRQSFGFLDLQVDGISSALVELCLFVVMLVVFFRMGDFKRLVDSGGWSLWLFLPLAALVVPLFGVNSIADFAVPSLLVVPSLFFVVLFVYCLFIFFRRFSV